MTVVEKYTCYEYFSTISFAIVSTYSSCSILVGMLAILLITTVNSSEGLFEDRAINEFKISYFH